MATIGLDPNVILILNYVGLTLAMIVANVRPYIMTLRPSK